MSDAPTSGHKRREHRADTDALRAAAANLYAEGKRATDVAAALGITPRRAKQLKRDVAPTIRAAAAKTIEGVLEGGERAKRHIATKAETLARVVTSAAEGELKDASGAIELDPAMVNARVGAAKAGLVFVLATKGELEVKAPLTAETAAKIAAIVQARVVPPKLGGE